MPLIEPGKYDITYNQQYLLEKLHLIDFWSAIINNFWFCLYAAIVAYIVVKIVRTVFKRAKQEEDEEATKKCFEEFHELCRLIHEDEIVFRRPQKMIQAMYYPAMRDCLQKMERNQYILNHQYRWLIPDYRHYKVEIAEWEKHGKL